METVATSVQVRSRASVSAWRKYCNGILSSEISSFTRYFDQALYYLPLPNDAGLLYEGIQCPSKARVTSFEALPDLRGEKDRRTAIVMNGLFNHHLDIEGLLREVRGRLSRTSRVVAIAYNPYLRWFYRLANRLGIRKGEEPFTFVTCAALSGIAKLSGFELVRIRTAVYCPFRLLGIGSLINRILPIVPGLRWLSFATVIVLRPVLPETSRPTLSIVIPARNERGNIENAAKRLLEFKNTEIEVIFVEGHSKDGTWEEILRVKEAYGSRLKIKAFRQTGKGKNDAVRLGFSHATGDLLTILDADLTMPPEKLGRFYEAYRAGLADFVNGSRLVYPMQGEAMRFLNRLGNVFFAKALSFVLGTTLSDSLCGTKLVSRSDYARFTAWRKDFGDFDPFGDFELLFPASELALGVVDVPVHYEARVYGTTNISRFRHGAMLLKMTLIGLFRLKLGRI